MRYFPLSETDREDIQKFLGIKKIRELFSDIPQDKAYYPLDELESALPENELLDKFRNLASRNTFSQYLNFLGAGAYRHFIPEVVNTLSMKGEFLTPYTPYQPEVSQGSLQAMFEYQTMMTLLTGMDVSNASLYDGGTAAAEAVLLAVRKSGKQRFLMAENLHPEYMEIIKTYIQNLDIEYELVPYDRESGKTDLSELEKKLTPETAVFIFQSPNFFGVIEECGQISGKVHQQNAFSVQVITEALSLAFLTPPGENDVDIAVGEAQSFGLPLSFGGPYLGFITAKEEFLRQMPGRIVGETVDKQGRRGYVLTLSTREQHIKREKATSNICTNQAWCALRASIYLSTMGKTGLEEIGKINHLNTTYFVESMKKFDHVRIRFSQDFYNEVVLETGQSGADGFLRKMEEQKVLSGIPLHWFYPEMKDAILINFTEMHTKKDIDTLITGIGDWR
jgi:glycine dehydrogenase subunit 1